MRSTATHMEKHKTRLHNTKHGTNKHTHRNGGKTRRRFVFAVDASITHSHTPTQSERAVHACMQRQAFSRGKGWDLQGLQNLIRVEAEVEEQVATAKRHRRGRSSSSSRRGGGGGGGGGRRHRDHVKGVHVRWRRVCRARHKSRLQVRSQWQQGERNVRGTSSGGGGRGGASARWQRGLPEAGERH